MFLSINNKRSDFVNLGNIGTGGTTKTRIVSIRVFCFCALIHFFLKPHQEVESCINLISNFLL